MSIAKQHLDINSEPIVFSIGLLGEAIKEACAGVIFALLMGSAKDGVVPPRSDLDLALYLKDRADRSIFSVVEDAVRPVVGREVRVDVGLLNGAEVVYRFEAIKGKLLFTRDKELWSAFFSLACREYETQMALYRRQRRYRMEVGG